MAVAAVASMGAPAGRVGDGQPVHELRHIPAVADAWPDDQVPVVGHQAVADQPQRHALPGLPEDALERPVVRVLPEQTGAAVAAVEQVIHITAHDLSGPTGHDASLTPRRRPVKTTPVPFSVPQTMRRHKLLGRYRRYTD